MMAPLAVATPSTDSHQSGDLLLLFLSPHMKKASKSNRYILYARKSTESDDRQVLSIESQINELKALAARDGLEIVAVLQESRSAKDLGRPVFAEMHERITRGQANGILCWKLDRLARNFIDGGSVIDALQR